MQGSRSARKFQNGIESRKSAGAFGKSSGCGITGKDFQGNGTGILAQIKSFCAVSLHNVMCQNPSTPLAPINEPGWLANQ